MFHFTALVTLLAIGLYFFTSFQVGKARASIRHQGAGDRGQSRISSGCFACR